MARDWEISNTLSILAERMSHFGENIAPIPICMTQEAREDGSLVWVVDLHIKVRGKTEFDMSAEGETLSAALRSVYLGLNNERGLVRRAAEANLAFGVAI